MKLLKSFIAVVVSLGLSTGMAGCGSSDDNVVARIVELFLDDRTISIGESTVLRSQFRFSEDRIFNDRDEISVVIRIPAEVSFREDSAEIQGDFDDEDVSPLITDCGVGQEKFLRFEFDDEDLSGAQNPDGSADAELALTLDAVSSGEAIVISAAADNDGVPFSCGGTFLADEETSMTIS